MHHFTFNLHRNLLTNRRGSYIISLVGCASSRAKVNDAEWCNGNTNDSDSFILGSNPSSAALPPWSSGLRRRPLTAKTGVRIPMEVPPRDSDIDTISESFLLHIFEDSMQKTGYWMLELLLFRCVLQESGFQNQKPDSH